MISGDAGIENVSGNQASEPRGNLQSHLPQGGPQIYGPGNVPGGPHGEFKSNLSGESKSEGDNAGSTAQQWLGGPTTPDPMTLIAGGVAQLQAVMLKQMSADSEKVKSGGSSPEAVKPGTPVLPLLPALSAQTSSVDVMDWLEMITTPMQDLSDGSSEWWSKVMKTANDFYNKWTLSSPVDKLTIHPVKDEELEAGKWSRVNSRAASMVMLALHETVRVEMVQRRTTGSTVGILFRLLTLYQPGGQREKVTILQGLQQPESESDPRKAVVSLRSWARWLRRCKDLGVSAPDPSLLTRGLTTMTKKVLEGDPEVSFRTSLVRSSLAVDTTPTYETVEKFYNHLLAECESMVVSSTSLAPSTSPTTTPNAGNRPDPKIKPMKPEPKNGNVPTPPAPPRSPPQSTTTGQEEQDKRGGVACRFFGKTFKGCARGPKCPFKHSWEGLEKEKPNRCWLCGGKHANKDCPTKKTTSPSTSPTSTSQNEGQKGTPPRSTSANPSSSSSSATTNKNVRINENPQVEPIPGRSATASAENVPDLKDVLADVGRMLKAMSATNLKRLRVTEKDELENIVDEFQMMASGVVVRAVNKGEDPREDPLMDRINNQLENDGVKGLLDSGASHAMKQATSAEYQDGIPVRVTLAGEDSRILRQNLHGTVLVEETGRDPVQPIVPLGALIEELGCHLQWNKGSVKLWHPTRGFIKVFLNNNCPEVNFKEAHKLIKELEQKQLKALNGKVEELSAKLEVMRKEENRSWTELLNEFVKTGNRSLLVKVILLCPFARNLPGEVQASLAESFQKDHGEKYLKELPLSRRKRKSLLNSQRWVVFLHQREGLKEGDPMEVVPKNGKVILEVNTKSSRLWDLNRPGGVYQLLLWAAADGRITDIVGSPPHETWPTARTPLRGPESYPRRTTAEPYGRDGLPPLQQQRLNEETSYVAKQMMLWAVAMASGNGNVGFMMEFPEDQENMQGNMPTQASLWTTEMWKSFKSVAGMSSSSFYLGAFGHRSPNPVRAATNYPTILAEHGNHSFGDNCVPTSMLSPEELREWPGTFKRKVAEAAIDFHEGHISSEEELADLDVKISKLSREQREEWKKHLENDHQPYRSDCSVCINAQATGYQHRRRKHPSRLHHGH